MSWPDDEPFELEPGAAEVESQRGGMLLVALGLVGGSLITAAVFWVSGFESPRPRGEMDRAEVSAVAPRPTPPHVAAGTTAAPVIADASPVLRDNTPAPSGTEAIPAEHPAAISPERVAHSEETAVSAEQQGTAAATTDVASETPAPRPASAHDVSKASTRLASAEMRSAAAEASACRRASTPADRLVCNDLALEMLDLQLREAYARALNARADPVILGAGQTAWRRARDEVSDPQRLAHLYDQRIRELNEAAATAQAVGPQD